MTAMTIYADDVAVGDVLDSGAVVTDVDVYDDGALVIVDCTVVNDDGAVEIIGFGYDDLLPILRATD